MIGIDVRFTALTAVILLGVISCGGTDVQRAPQNVVLVITDDVGYEDLLSNEAGTMENVRALADVGVTFERAYSASRVCSPARFGLFSGRAPSTHGWFYNPLHSEAMPLSIETVAEQLQPLGVRSEFIGKWHLGEADGYTPLQQGFEYFFGFRGGAHDYWIADQPGHGSKSMMWENDEQVITQKQLTDAMFEKAAERIDKWSPDGRNFLVLSTNAAHGPMQPTPRGLAPLAGSVPEPRSHYLGHVVDIDRGMGLLLDALEEAGVDDQTTVIITNDHGGRTRVNDIVIQDGPNAPERRASGPLGDNGILRGDKGRLLEGGIRVPLIISRPDFGRRSVMTPVNHLDLYPTIIALFDGDPPETVDGQSLLPCLLNAECEATTPYFYVEPKIESIKQKRFADGTAAMVSGPWKIIVDKDGSTSIRLYNLVADPQESSNRASTESQRADALLNELEEFLSNRVDWNPAASKLLKNKYPDWWDEQ